MNKALGLDIEMDARVYFSAQAIHYPIHIISDKLNNRPNCQKQTPKRQRAEYGGFLLRYIDKRVKKSASNERHETIGNGGNNAENH